MTSWLIVIIYLIDMTLQCLYLKQDQLNIAGWSSKPGHAVWLELGIEEQHSKLLRMKYWWLAHKEVSIQEQFSILSRIDWCVSKQQFPSTFLPVQAGNWPHLSDLKGLALQTKFIFMMGMVFRWLLLRGSKRHRGRWERRQKWSLKVQAPCRWT